MVDGQKTGDELAISVKDLHKTFRIPLEGGNNLKQRIVNFASRKKGYREFSPLNGVSFDIKKGEFFGIVGRNGSGKSTLLKTIAGIYTADGGKLTVNGTLVPFIELGVGFNPELTGRENVYLNGALLGFSRDEMASMYDDIVDFAELHDFMDERLKNYSSGMQVRLAFSIAIRAEGDILLLDEVLAVGDESFQRKCYEYFSQLKKNKKTVILVTHSMESMQRFCTRAALINDGEVDMVGPAADVAERYQELNSSIKPKPDSEVTLTAEGSLSSSGVTLDISMLNDKAETVTRITGGDGHFTIGGTLKFSEDINDAFVGLTIRKSSGELVFWYTTEAPNKVVDTFKSGRDYKFSLRMQNILGEGEYRVAVLVKSTDRAEEFYINNSALSFSVVNRGINGFMLHPDYRWKMD